MSSEVMSRLPRDANVAGWTPQQAALMRQIGVIDRVQRGKKLPDAPTGAIEAFLQQCARTGLDPFSRQIYLIERGGKWSVETGIDGYRLIAMNTMKFEGAEGPFWSDDGMNWVEGWTKTPEHPYPSHAKVTVYREGFRVPLTAVARWEEYVQMNPVWAHGQKTGEFEVGNMWQKMPSLMLGKVAEALALRRAFPQDLSGIYTSDEMAQATNDGDARRAAAESLRPEASAHRGSTQMRQGSSRGQQRAAQPQVLSELEWNTWRERLSQASSRDDALDVWRAAQSDNMLGKVLPPTDGVAQGTTLGQFIKEFGKEVARREKEAEAAAEPAPNEEVAQVVEDSPAVEVTGEPVKSPDEEWADKVESGELKADEAF